LAATADLTDADVAIIAKLLRDTIAADGYPLSARVRAWLHHLASDVRSTVGEIAGTQKTCVWRGECLVGKTVRILKRGALRS
jgi:hypothetical protein